nr:hypothetical protein BaRGS_012401 [Batillaria attramentaria]
MPRVQETDVRDDHAMQQVLQSIRQVAERRQEVMMVLSQLQFRKYLDNQVDPITAAATRLLPRPATLGVRDGDLDILLVSRQFGLIVGEVKSVGHKPKYTTDQAIVKTVQKAVKQLKKADVTLRQLVSDLAPVNVTRILMLPNITSQRLMTALSTDPQTEQDLCQCVGATDTAAAVARCLCSDSCDQWWERSVTDHGQDTNMTNDIYERLVARETGQCSGIRPEDCERCADDITRILVDELRVGQSGHDLQYRDTIILCLAPRDEPACGQQTPCARRARAGGDVSDDEAAIRNVALSTGNQVTVTDWRVVSGLERRVVVVMGFSASETIMKPKREFAVSETHRYSV